MSEASKVLHLYVEVRTVPEKDGEVPGRAAEGTHHLMLPSPDILPSSKRSATCSSRSRSPELSRTDARYHTTDENHTITSSKSSSRHSVSFQLQNPDRTGSSIQAHHQDVLYDGSDQLLHVLSPGRASPSQHNSPGPVWLNVPSTLTSNCSSVNVPRQDQEEKSSMVTFGYIEKANVHSVEGRHSSMCHAESDRVQGQLQPAHLRKRLSDPMWFSGRSGQGDLYLNHPYTSQTGIPQASPHLRKATLDAVARQATYKALEEFGSPELRRRYASRGPENYSPSLPRSFPPPRCQSLGASPVLPRSTLTLPSKAQLLELDRGARCSSVNGLPRSPASEHLCDHTGYSSPGISQKPWVRDERPRLPSIFYPPLPAGKPTDIQHEIHSGRFASSNQPQTDFQCRLISQHNNHPSLTSGSHKADDGIQCHANNNSNTSNNNLCKASRCSSRASDVVSPTTGRRSISPSSNREMACKLAVEATRLCNIYADRRTPSPTPSQSELQWLESPKGAGSFQRESQLYDNSYGQICPGPPQAKNRNHSWKDGQPTPQTRPGRASPPPPSQKAELVHRAGAPQSPLLDPQQRWSSSTSKDASTVHRYQPPQFTGDCQSHDTVQRHYDRSTKDSPDVPWRLLSQNTEASEPASWTTREAEEFCEDRHPPSRVYTPSKEQCLERDRKNKDVKTSMQFGLSRVQRGEALDQSRGAGMSSQSSSGVTGSMGDDFPMDRYNSLSPETSSQSSYDTADSGKQLDCGLETSPSLRSQKIARAKWEFLFGGQAEEGRHTKGALSTTPPTSNSPSPTPPSTFHLRVANQKRTRNCDGQRLSHHKVRQIEVELMTPDPRCSIPKTGIVRRTIKFSETDLDAVPLRCYRETDLDEVMRAEAEANEEADSAFGSKRSIVENVSFSPVGASQKPRTGGVKQGDEEEEEEGEDEDEEGVVSWASVRMQGDKQRQRATKEEGEVLSLLLKGSSEALTDTRDGLKSPISVGSPRRPCDSNLDSFSRHFENIMESHRAKGTSYSSLDSVDLLTSGSTSVFTFDLPTLTPEIQSQICESAKQIMELSFAPLAHPDPSAASETSRSEITLSALGTRLQSGSKVESGPPVRTSSEKDTWRRSILKDGFRKASSAPSLHSSLRERPVHRPAQLLLPQADVAQRLALGGSDEALANGTKTDLQAAKRLAKRLYTLDGFKKSDVARHLGKNNDFSHMVAEEYLTNFNFMGLTLDQALRTFLTQFALMGETQERERVLAHFSRRYRQCNPESLSTEDSVHTLTCAVMLLNTDLHGNNVGKRMSCSQFISNLEGLNEGKDFPKDMLKTLYSSIKNEKLQWTIDEEELRKSMSELADVRTDSASHTMKRLGSGGNLLAGAAQQADGELYKSGFLVRKAHADPDGKRTPRGRRGWKTFYAMLKGLVLYLQKDEYRTERELTEDDVKNAVSVHHCLAMRAADYSKRPNVFYLRTADWRVFLFQAPNAEQMQSWITRINVVAAMFSAPPFPAAIGSQKRFSRPLLPGSNTKLSQEEQVKSHENRFRAVSSELADLTASTPDRKVKGRELEEQKLRQEYLEFEKTRYGTYAMLLRAKQASGDEDLTAFEARLFDNGGLQRAHSSPTLPQDGANKEKSRGTKTSKSLKVTSSSSSASKSKKRNESKPLPELQKQGSKQEEAA